MIINITTRSGAVLAKTVTHAEVVPDPRHNLNPSVDWAVAWFENLTTRVTRQGGTLNVTPEEFKRWLG